jgi:hypothetical protein
MIAARRQSISSAYLPPATALTDEQRVADGGSADPEKNVALLNVIKKVRADGVPKTNIESALQKVCIYVQMRGATAMSGARRSLPRSLLVFDG